MKKTTIFLYIVSLVSVSVWADDCDPQPQPQPIPTVGFKIRAFVQTTTDPNRGIIPDQHRGIFAQWRSDKPGVTGNKIAISAVTDTFGEINVDQGRAPARWDFRETNGLCAGLTITLDVERGKVRELYCLLVPRFTGGFVSSPSAVEAESTPATITVYGEDFSAAYGLPLIRYFDLNGVLVAETYADQVAPDGSWLTGSTTDLSSVSSGQYTVMICNAAADGTWETLGAATVEVFHYVDPPPDPDPCGCSASGNVCVEQMPCSVY